MSYYQLLQRLGILIILSLCYLVSGAQVRIYGTVYDRTAKFGMAGVTVMSTSGKGTITDSAGHYSIIVPTADSICFSYQGKATMKFPVKEIRTSRSFDMSLHVDVHMLPTVEVSAQRRGYTVDSIENRREYRKVFDFEREYFTSGGAGSAAGLNLDLLFSMKKIKRIEAFRKILIQDEKDKYVDHRFNKELVKKITGLESPALEAFMIQFRPSYEFILSFDNDYDYYEFIKVSSEYFSSRYNKNRANHN
ncbi:hypothetical protein DVR12_20870 [Chitinophaga silvatica]|uniref:CarboxypepD_reg-like domain-containing protein n=1 Tax=Chitinophaga silvatica TaxID=2282649 RepID=A0A3E1Y5Z3_9BACT|nr:hypothetical protein [Chitinophaga silvatica]RFS20170.1 hypothetical protein DVR12_20870 [Chitinophaga silvatica]